MRSFLRVTNFKFNTYAVKKKKTSLAYRIDAIFWLFSSKNTGARGEREETTSSLERTSPFAPTSRYTYVRVY